MTDWKRRRLVQAAASLPLLGLAGARAQAPSVAPGVPLLIAPRRALVIGNSSYGFGPLKNPANDAKAIGDALRTSGFEVNVGLDLSRQQMLEAIRAYGESLNRAKAIGIFYFAGHGVQLAWRNYLLPIDAEIRRVEDIAAKCVDVNAVIERIAKAANPMNVVILDACRENPFAGVKLEQRGLSQLDAPAATLLAYATAPGNLASDGEGANGLYTEQLLKEIRVPEAKIEDVFKRVRLTVRRRSNGAQIPWESTSLEEDFWFIPPKEMQKLADAERERIRKANGCARSASAKRNARTPSGCGAKPSRNEHASKRRSAAPASSSPACTRKNRSAGASRRNPTAPTRTSSNTGNASRPPRNPDHSRNTCAATPAAASRRSARHSSMPFSRKRASGRSRSRSRRRTRTHRDRRAPTPATRSATATRSTPWTSTHGW
jgi:hypothetical protein